MSKVIKTREEYACRTVVVDGVCLHIVATHTGGAEWQLYIENELGIRTNWITTFASAETALKHGADAIEAEGIAPFVEIEGFEYLLDS